MNDSTSTTLTTTGGTPVATSGYSQPDWSTYQPSNVIDYGQTWYPPTWGGWYPAPIYPMYPVYPYIPAPQIVTQQIIIPRGLTDEEIDKIADRVAEKLRKAKRRPRVAPGGETP